MITVAYYALVLLLLITSFSSTAISQQLTPPSPTSIPTMADCTQRLLPLAPCSPYVQGVALAPSQSCCFNVNQLYSQQPARLCLLLNSTTISSFPINHTLAMSLPVLCNIQVNISTCSGIPAPEVPTTHHLLKVSLGANTNSTAKSHPNSSIATSPMIQVAPRPTILGPGSGFSQNDGIKLKTGPYVLLVTVATIFFP